MESENETMDAYSEIFDQLEYLGPGDEETTRGLVERLRPNLPKEPRVADFGCGTGASAMMLAQCLPGARILALDSHAPFIEGLEVEADTRGLGDRISARVGDMENPPKLDGVYGEFDLIWSESAIYSIGRIQGMACWRPMLKPGGWLVFSEIVWRGRPEDRSDKAAEFWAREYPDMTTAANILEELTASGYRPDESVKAPRKAWSNYYEPIRDRLRSLEMRSEKSQALIDVMAEFERELNVYDSAGNEVGLCFFIACRK